MKKALSLILGVIMVTSMLTFAFASNALPEPDDNHDGHEHDDQIIIDQTITLEDASSENQIQAAAACTIHVADWILVSSSSVSPSSADLASGACSKKTTKVVVEKYACTKCGSEVGSTRTTRTITPHYFVYQAGGGYQCNYGCGTWKL